MNRSLGYAMCRYVIARSLCKKAQRTISILPSNPLSCNNISHNILPQQVSTKKFSARLYSESTSNMIIRSEFPTVPVPEEPFPTLFLNAIWEYAIKNSSRSAMINISDEEDQVTFGQLHTYSHLVAAFLHDQKFAHKDCCCVVLPNCWEYMAIFGGITFCGGVMSGACPSFTAFELKQQFEDSKSKIVFCSEHNIDQVLLAAKQVPKISHVIVALDRNSKKSLLSDADYHFSILSFDDVIQKGGNIGCLPVVDYKPSEDVLILPYSSGTTGPPKGVMISHRNFAAMMTSFAWQFDRTIIPAVYKDYKYEKEIQLDVLPFYHIFGIGMIVHHLLRGSTVAVMKTFDPNLLCKSIEKYKCRILMLVPPIMIFLAKSPIVNKYNLSSLLCTISGAAPAGKELCEELQRRLPNLKVVAQGYGMTEVSLCSHLPVIDGKVRYEKAGKLMPNNELKILDIETREELGRNMVGEIYIRGPTVMMGYYNRPDATKETIDNRGWLRTGDIAFVDDEGYLQIVDRLKELIKVRGHQVAPAELEDILLSHPGITDCAVIGVKDQTAGELPKAFVVRKNENLTEVDVINYTKERVVYYKNLKGGVQFVNEIPKSASGKIMRRVLRDIQRKSEMQKL